MSRGQRRPTSRRFRPYRTGAAKSLSHASATTHLNPNTYCTLWRGNTSVYNTLCTKQKQMNLTHSLLQDITVFNEYNSTKLEDWLTDIETAAISLMKVELNLPKQNQED